MSPVVNKSTTPATTQAQPSNPTPPITSATAAATTGAVAGDTSRRAAEQQRLTLPRIAQTVIVAATRNYGVPDNETDLLR